MARVVPVHAAPYAAMVIDARTGEVLHSRNADTRLHPASLTKMMTLYIAFQAVENGEISLDTMVTISKHAASEPPSKLGLRPGQKIKLRFLIRAAAIKSANDAATAIGEAISGSEAAFARRMNRTAKSLGMSRTTFKNAHGLTESGHLSTARDMTTLGRHVFYDYPDYYNLFSRRSTHAGVREVANTNRKFLNAYRGADGIKTGYTRAAGFNLVASAERGRERIITTVFGGNSTASRNAKVAELMDLGFARAPSRATVRRPVKPAYVAERSEKIVRVVMAVRKTERPRPRPAAETPAEVVAASAVALKEAIEEAVGAAIIEETVETVPVDVQTPDDTTIRPRPRPVLQTASLDAASDVVGRRAINLPDAPAVRLADASTLAPVARPKIVSRISTSGARHYGIHIGSYPTRHKAESMLLQTALTEMGTLGDALRKVVHKNSGFDANFVGMTEEGADLACKRLAARGTDCQRLGPS
ncbi:MAG: D-alanyl-D-alanine carboxypeptidase family protein [Pseudomonadota bacterium]